MFRSLVYTFIALAGFPALLAAQEGIQRGQLKKVDAAKGVITITVEGKDHDFTVGQSTRIMDAAGKAAQDGLKHPGFKEGAMVQFKAGTPEGKTVLAGLKLAGPSPMGPQDIHRGRIKKVDAAKGRITVTVEGEDRNLTVTENTQIRDAANQPVRDGLKDAGFKEGAWVMYRTGARDGKAVLAGLKLLGANPQPSNQQKPPPVDLSKLVPLTEMGTTEYQGFPGGLYPNGKNERPASHEAAGRELAKQVQPLDADGKPGTDGKNVVLSVGMSNTNQAFGGLMRIAGGDKDMNPRVVLVNGAQGGMTAALIQKEDGGRAAPNGQRASYWPQVDKLLAQADVTRAQVQVVWIKQADAGPSEGFPGYARKLEGELERIVQLLHRRFPNLKLVYLSSRTYGGFAKTRLNPEPYAYESGFSVKWLVEKQIQGDPALNYDARKGEVKAPWLSWGPYLWARGADKRSDGFSYEESDFSPSDGTHESGTGVLKIGRQLLHFFKTDSTTKGWFVKKPD